jgi:hypothetical protein
MLLLTENELNKIKDLSESIKNSEDYTNLKIKVEEQVNDFLNRKKDIFNLAVMAVLDLMKKIQKRNSH